MQQLIVSIDLSDAENDWDLVFILTINNHL